MRAASGVERPQRLGLFGGSFDPIHRGHVAPVLHALEQAGLDGVIYLPTAVPPHKEGRRFAPAWARYVMVELALLDHARLQVSPHELTLGRRAYTVETVEHFQELRPEVEWHLILGADSYNDLPKWRRWRDLIGTVRLVVLARPTPRDGGSKLAGRGLRPGLPPELDPVDPERVVWLENQTVDVSSTRLRSRLAKGEEPDQIEPAVLHYIRKYGLYQADDPAQSEEASASDPSRPG